MKNQPVEHIFMQLVQIDSPTNEERLFSDYLVKLLKSLQVNIVKQDKRGNIYARLNGVDDPLFFSAHLDTVEPGKNIHPSVKNGSVVSDGTTIVGADNKSSLASMIKCIEELQNSKIPHRTLEFIFTRSEEINSYGAIEFNYQLVKAKRGYCFDSVAPVGTITLASPFYERFDIMFKGKAAHASKVKEGRNALAAAAEFIDMLPLGNPDKITTLNIGLASAGSARNTIPGTAILNGEIRSLEEKNVKNVKKIISDAIRLTEKKHKLDITIDYVRENGGYNHTSKMAKQFIEDTKKIMMGIKMKPIPMIHWGVSDANIFNEKGLLCLNLGDGVVNPHTVQETVKISDMEQLTKLMISFVTI